jgi:hypothetical protein
MTLTSVDGHQLTRIVAVITFAPYHLRPVITRILRLTLSEDGQSQLTLSEDDSGVLWLRTEAGYSRLYGNRSPVYVETLEIATFLRTRFRPEDVEIQGRSHRLSCERFLLDPSLRKHGSGSAISCTSCAGSLWAWSHGQTTRLECPPCFATCVSCGRLLTFGCGYQVGPRTSGSPRRPVIPESGGYVRTYKNSSAPHCEHYQGPL